jgi:RNA polymerase sigma factor (sigma-70 family)
MDDATLLKEYRQTRSEAAFQRIVDAHGSMVYAVCLRRLGGRKELAEEAAQTVFVLLMQRLDKIQRPEQLPGWLHQTAVFTSGHLRTTERRLKAREALAGTMPREVAKPMTPEREELCLRLDGALAELPERQRTVVVLRYFEGLSVSETAQRLACGERSVRYWLDTALRKLRRRLGATEAGLSVVGLAAWLQTLQAAPLPAHWSAACWVKVQAGAAVSFASASASTTAAVGTAAWKWFVGIAFAAMIGTVGVWQWSTTNEPETKAEPSDKLRSLPVRWEFSQGPASDLIVQKGEWRWQAAEGDGSGAMIPLENSGIVIDLPVRLPEEPVRISVCGRQIRTSTPYSGLSIERTDANGQKQTPVRYWKSAEPRFMSGSSTTVNSWMIGKYDVSEEAGKIRAVVEHREGPSSGGLRLSLLNYLTEEISVEAVKPEELPLAMRDIAALIKTMNDDSLNPETIHLTWRFEDGVPENLLVMQGTWRLVKGDADAPAVMTVGEQGVKVFLPQKMHPQPFVVAVKAKPPRDFLGVGGVSMNWWKNGLVLNGLRWDNLRQFGGFRNDGPMYDLRFYFIEEWQIVVFGERSIGFVLKYDTPYPGSHLVFGAMNFDIEEIKLDSLRPEEIPNFLRNPAALAAAIEKNAQQNQKKGRDEK